MQRGTKRTGKPKEEQHVAKKTCRFVPNPEVVRKLESEYADFRPQYFQALSALLNLTSGIEKMIDTYFVKEDFSRSRYLTLMMLFHEPSHRLTPNEIAGKLEFTRGNMTGLIDQLLKDGYVTKTSDPVDRRQVWIGLTPKGESFLRRIFPDYFRRLAKMMSAVSREEILEFIRISNRIHDNIPLFWEDGK